MPKPFETRTEETTSLGFARSPIDACDEAVYRLNVVIRILSHHNCVIAGGEGDDVDSDEGGYDIAIMRKALADVRDMLRLSVQAQEKISATSKNGKAGA